VESSAAPPHLPQQPRGGGRAAIAQVALPSIPSQRNPAAWENPGDETSSDITQGEHNDSQPKKSLNPFRVHIKRLFPKPRALPSAIHIRPFQGQLYLGSIGHNDWTNSRVPTPKASNTNRSGRSPDKESQRKCEPCSEGMASLKGFNNMVV
jgi:hypothetical protein